MKPLDRRSLLVAAALAPSAARLSRSSEDPTADERRAAAVLAAAASFERGGGYDRTWGSSGAPAAIEFQGQTILRASTEGTYCCGFTFAVAMGALRGAGALEGKSVADVRAFQKRWFGATNVAVERERQCAVAVRELGVGREVDADDALPGDFLQLWRKTKKPSGHSVLFLSWISIGDERIGVAYLSSQGSTNGIGYGVEYMAGAPAGRGTVDPKRLWVARLDAVG